jgi:SWI/SNF-related matrix-associated actin-dependent regulator of chromatin subfamily A containing DEAD/H box 1
MNSGKVEKLVELLKKFKENGDRCLIFSQFTSVMDILEWVLQSIDMPFFRMDGSTPIAQRQDMLDEFYADTSIPVFMLSTKSGGAGINLACANKVIIFDSSFNPQDDIQAENRAHRVGQIRDVEVVRLVTRGTVEEQIHALGVSKLELDKMVAGEEAAETPLSGSVQEAPSNAEVQGMQKVEEMLLAELERGKKQK